MPITQHEIISWLVTNAEQQILIPANFLFRLQQQMIRGVKVMPTEDQVNDWIYAVLVDLGPPGDHFPQWQSRLRMALADCKSTGRFTKSRVTLEDSLAQFR